MQSFNKNDPSLLSLHASRKPDHQSGFGSSLLSTTVFCGLRGNEILCTEFSRSLGEELKTRGITVTAVCPGPVDTPFFAVSGKPQNFLKELTMAQPGPVVHQALKDSRKRKELSIYGLPMKLTYVGTKLLPHKLLLRIQNL